MATGANEALVRRFYDEVWNRGNVEVAREILVDDFGTIFGRGGAAGPGRPGGGPLDDDRHVHGSVGVVEPWNHRDDLGLMEQVGAAVFAGSARDPDGPAGDA